MNRNALDKLIAWKNDPDKKPLIIINSIRYSLK